MKVDPNRFQFVTGDDPHARLVCYGNMPVMTQMFDDPDSASERKRSIAAATSLLEYRWSAASSHARMSILAAIDGDGDD
ncbi:hypothetical protein [Paracoccus beibuensis]|uniref:hypothetical protein n=1 Tax=Paracoccus beibuensis TaxID=547602 RepID=UPI00223EB23C|nr:hypothetical protein [Paracoccus beibuensis]